MTPDLMALAERMKAVAPALEVMAGHMETVAAIVLVEGSNRRRAGFLRCSGCPECAEPLPTLTGDVP